MMMVAAVAIVVYPIGLLVLNACLLFCARKAIIAGEPTPLANAIHFLHSEYEADYFWWELMEMLRRLVLVGVFVLIERGSITQITLGAVFCQVFLLLQTQANPLKDTADDYLANASSFAMCVIFVCCIAFKISTLTELRDVHTRMSIELQNDFRVPTDLLSMILFLSVFSAVVLSFVFLLGQLAIERARYAKDARTSLARRLRYRDTKLEVLAPALDNEGDFHLFLSHVWGTGQDQMRVVKQRLLEMVPDLRVFLDVDGTRLCSSAARAG